MTHMSGSMAILRPHRLIRFRMLLFAASCWMLTGRSFRIFATRRSISSHSNNADSNIPRCARSCLRRCSAIRVCSTNQRSS